MKPFVSVLTPTYNRRKFIPSIIQCYKSQDYPKDRMEWIILDDGQESSADLFGTLALELPNIRYIHFDKKENIGTKRNLLNQLAKGDIFISMDDDDWYHPERVSHVVKKFHVHPAIQLAGSSEVYMYYTDTEDIYKLGPYEKRHATNGTLAVRSGYAKSHSYDEYVTFAEERSFLDEYIHPMIQLDPLKVMLVMSHSENTFDKDQLRAEETPFVKKTTLKLKDFIKDKTAREFYYKA